MINPTQKKIAIHDLITTTGVKFGTSGVRGLVSNMSDELCFAYTLAFIQALKLPKASKLAVAIDLRASSPTIASACCAAAIHSGINVDYCGAIPTPALAYYTQQESCAGIMVTGSHIPFDRNGIKFYSAEGEITKQHEEMISNATVTISTDHLSIDLPELNNNAKVLYIKRYLDYFKPNAFTGTKLAFYEHSSVARDILRELLESLGAEVISLGRTNEFVPIDTEAVSQIDVERGLNWAKEYAFDAIISTDGDADRPLIGDENGNWLRGDIIGLLTSQYLQAEAVATPVSCNTAIEKSNFFKKVVRTRIGSPYVIEAMSELGRSDFDSIVGFEANGGYLLGSKFGLLEPLCTRDAVLPMLSIIALAKTSRLKVSELLKTLPERYTASDRLQSFATEKSKEILNNLSSSKDKIQALLGNLVRSNLESINQTDGLRLTFENKEVIHYRPSGNAPELRCYAESNEQNRANILTNQALKLIQTV